MNGITQLPLPNAFEIKRLVPGHHNYLNKLVDARALFEAFPNAKNYVYLEPNIRTIYQATKEGLLAKGKTFLSIFDDSQKVIWEEGDYVKHRLYVDNNNLRGTILKIDHIDTAKLGKGGATFSIWTDVDLFGHRDVLLIDTADYAPLLVMDAEPDGGYYRYDLVVNAMEGYVSGKDIKPGAQFRQIGALRGEAADARGNVHIATGDSYLEFMTPRTRMGWSLEVTDDAWRKMERSKQMYQLLPNQDFPWDKFGGTADTTAINTNLMEMKFKAATDMHIDLWMIWGKRAGKFKSPFLDKLTAKPLDSGPGLGEWMESATRDFYPPGGFSIPWLAKTVSRRWDNNVEPNDRVAHFGTGRLGLIFWEKAAKDYGMKGYLEEAEMYEENSGNGWDGMRNGVVINKKQVVGAFLPQFGKIMIHYLPFLDDMSFERRTYEGYSVRSGDFICLDDGYGTGKDANVYIVRDPSENGFGYGNGLWTPWGAAFKAGAKAQMYPTTLGKKNAYELIRDEAFTVVVKNPTAILWLQMAVK